MRQRRSRSCGPWSLQESGDGGWVRVRWSNRDGADRLYRLGAEGKYDLRCIFQPERDQRGNETNQALALALGAMEAVFDIVSGDADTPGSSNIEGDQVNRACFTALRTMIRGATRLLMSFHISSLNYQGHLPSWN
jgi:hypothetical protein